VIRNLAYCWLRLIRCIMEVRIFIRLHLIHNELCFMQIVDMLIFPNRDSAAKMSNVVRVIDIANWHKVG